MNTFSKIVLGFILGVVCTVGVLYINGKSQNTKKNQTRDEISTQKEKEFNNNSDIYENAEKNIHSFELITKKGIVNLYTYMPKDSVKALMGRPNSTDIVDNEYRDEVRETWKYRGSNNYIDEFTIEFVNGKLKSVRQHKDH